MNHKNLTEDLKRLGNTFFRIAASAAFAALIVCLVFSGCTKGTNVPTVGSEIDHPHTLAVANNMVEHEAVGYCGNTVTTVRRMNEWEGAENREISFWGSDSVTLTDLLTYLDYSEETCDCLPEYTVQTELDDETYGISLSEGYARHNGKQVSLTTEQVAQIKDILERNFK